MLNMKSILLFTPELILSLTAILLLVLGIASSRRANIAASSGHSGWLPDYSSWLGISGLASAFVILVFLWENISAPLFGGLISLDSFSIFFRWIFISAAMAVVIFSQRSEELSSGQDKYFSVKDAPEYYAIILGMTVGMCMLSATSNILVIYLSLEFVGLMSYVLVGFSPNGEKSKEAALKYILFGAVASGVFLFGASIFYGITGSLNLTSIALKSTVLGAPFALAAIFMLAGFLFKIAAVPMQAWCPDAYEGAPTPITAFLSVAPKAAGFAVLMRVASIIGISAHWPLIIAVISAATMTFGNLAAIPQTSVKRLLAYSSIAHAGYLLMGVACASAKGNEAVYFYLIAYLVMNLGAFLAVEIVENATGSNSIDAFAGLSRRGVRGTFVAIAMTIFLLSLTGIPPFVGFIGKFYLFWAVLDAKLYWLAVIGILNSVVSLYYYMRIVKAMFLGSEEETKPFDAKVSRLYILLGVLAALTLALGLAWGGLNRLVSAV